VSAAAALARERRQRLCLVGGAVRDLFLGRPVKDVDLAIEGEAAEFAAALAGRLGARAIAHARFGTAALELPGGSRVDLASTRRETYAYPGALPAVAVGANIEEDLARRDFSIHAIALDLSRKPPAVLDPFAGLQDLGRRRIRFLHPASPADDPTRAFRAARYANRLSFSIPADARRQIGTAIAQGSFDAVSGDRLRRELVLIFEEPRRARAVALLIRLGVDGAVAAGLARAAVGATERVRAAERLAGGKGVGWLCYFLAWMGPAPVRALREVADRLALSGREALALGRWAETRRRMGPGIARLAPSRRRLRSTSLSPEEILAAAALRSGPDRRALARLAAREAPELAISGADLVARGVPQGPAIGRALAATQAAREDGRLTARNELAFALAHTRRSR
jgi:tRNA nucleotidyltransferase (CCA-adding enzyme)